VGLLRYDVLIITSWLYELDPVLALGEDGRNGWGTDKDDDGFPFHFRELPREDGGEPLCIAVASLEETGGDITASRVTSLIKFLNPACLAMCGICTGKKKAVFLGDVIVASFVYRYDSGKLSATRRGKGRRRVEKFLHDFKTFNLKDTWRVDAKYFAQEKDWIAELGKTRPLSLETQQQWFLRALLEHEQHGAPTPNNHPDRREYCPSFTVVRDRLRQRGLLVNERGLLALTEEGRGHAIDLTHEEELPKDPKFDIHVGAIATAEAEHKDSELFDQLEEIERRTLGVEKAAAVIGRIGEQLGCRTIIVKAVSDYGDEDENVAFRKFAAHASTQVLIRLLLRNLEPIAEQLDDVPKLDRRDPGSLHFERMGLERESDLLAHVQAIAELRTKAKGETAKIVRIRAPAPFGGYLRVSTVEDPSSVFPIAAVGEVSAEVLEAFLNTIDIRYRRNASSIHSVLVYDGARPSAKVVSRAQERHVLLQRFSEYQGLIDFRGYLERRVDQVAKNVNYSPALYVTQHAVVHSDGSKVHTTDARGELNTLLVSPHARFILVLGDFDTGKTFLLHELTRQMAKEGGLLVPVLIELRTLEKAQVLDALVVRHMREAGVGRFDLSAFRYMLAHGRIALLFDGFDELALRVGYELAVEYFSKLLQEAQGEAKVVVTSSSQHFYSDLQMKSGRGDQVSFQRGYRLVRLQRFTHEQAKEFLEKRLGDKEEAARRMKLIAEVKGLPELVENPRMLRLFADIPEQELLEEKARQGSITADGLLRGTLESG
jgi:nucleoside phosphorylase